MLTTGNEPFGKLEWMPPSLRAMNPLFWSGEQAHCSPQVRAFRSHYVGAGHDFQQFFGCRQITAVVCGLVLAVGIKPWKNQDQGGALRVSFRLMCVRSEV